MSDTLRSHFIVARAILRMLLGKYLGQAPERLAFGAGPQGKPMLLSDGKATGDLRFNLSHSHRCALYAFTRAREVGIDVERVRENVDVLKLAERFFGAHEVSALQERSPKERRRVFFTLWVCREACLKAWGTGLTFPLNRLEVELIPEKSFARVTIKKPGVETRSYQVRLLSLGRGYVGAVAAEGEEWGVRCWQWKESGDPDSMR